MYLRQLASFPSLHNFRDGILWCVAHQDRSETMRLGMLLEPAYPAVEYAAGHTLCEGREAWLRFHLHPQSSVEMGKRQVIALIEE